MNLYNIGKVICTGILKPLYRVDVIGAENIPSHGGVLICSNHIDNLDPPIVGISAKRPIHFMAKEEIFRVPILKNLLPSLNAFPVKRGMSDKQALKTGLQILRDGKVLGLFPEGTRSKTGQLGKGLAGAGFFALRTNASVIPCAIIGPYKPFKSLKVVFGEAINFESIRAEKVSAEEATDIIMNSIQSLLEKYQ
ncbi:lysophospholipid acyltransferase family protein [Bacillus salitolerans]|uniref:Lysophospholipid acyltransferase family protein n=1 Tax=Bacillus salitolerans TaxID=1437434 RepID=A0ABW4LU32_9BACI